MNPARGVAFKLISAALFAVMSALIRQLGARYPIGQVVFYRSVFAIIPVVLVYAWRGELAAIVRTERPLGQAGRGVLSIAGMFFNFGAVARRLVLGYAMFGETPTAEIVLGSAIIAAAGLFVIWRERQLAALRRREVPAPAATRAATTLRTP